MPSLALACRLSAVSRASRRPFSPASLFSAGEQGAWYDPSDMSTLFQDSAGTVPVTAVEQPVGLMLDKSGRGNHANQSTTASRPTLSARVNLLTKTEQFNDAAWVKNNVTVTTNTIEAPDGTLTADTLTAIAANGNIRNDPIRTGEITSSIYVKRKTGTGSVQLLDAAGTYRTVTVTSEWTNVDYTAVATGPSLFGIRLTVSGDEIYIWAASAVPTNQSTLPYQRVNTATDYDTAGFPYYLLFDGVDDYLSTGNINFSATDKMTVLTADHSAWDDSLMAIAGLSSSPTGNNGTFWLTAYDFTYNASSRAYLRGNLIGAGCYGPDQRTLGVRRLVRSFRFDISKDVVANEMLIRLNGVPTPLADPLIAPSAGSGNFGNWPLYIGRIGYSSPFNGRLYGLIVRGAATDDIHLTHAEKYLAYKSGVSL